MLTPHLILQGADNCWLVLVADNAVEDAQLLSSHLRITSLATTHKAMRSSSPGSRWIPGPSRASNLLFSIPSLGAAATTSSAR